MGSALRCGLLAVAILFSLACAPLYPECGQVCETVCVDYTVVGTNAARVDPDALEYAPAVEACFADDLQCDRLCFLTLDRPCGAASFRECTATRQPDGRLLVEADYTLHCRDCTTTCSGMPCAPDSRPMPDARDDAARDAQPEPDDGAMPDDGAPPDGDLVDAPPPDAPDDAA